MAGFGGGWKITEKNKIWIFERYNRYLVVRELFQHD